MPIEHLATFEAPGGLRVEHYRLTNGLTVLCAPDTRAPVFSYQTWLGVGSAAEMPGKSGLAHLFEHLMFKGTPTHPEGEYDRRIEGFGGRTNAATWLDWTYYYADAPSGCLSEVVTLEADRFAHIRVDAEQLTTERKVVLNERRETVDNEPGGRLSEVLWARSFRVHPYGRPTIGWAEDIEGLTLEDCRAFRTRWYAPDNAVVVVAGDVVPDAVLKSIDAGYGGLEPGEPSAPFWPQEPARTAPEHEVVELPITGERLLMGYLAPAVTDPDHAAFELLEEILFEGDSARLFRALVTDGELATEAYAFVPEFRDPGLFEVSVDLRPGRRAAEAEAVVLEAFAAVCAHGIDDAELAKAKSRVETRFWRGLQTAQQRAQSLGYWQITAGDFRRVFQVADAWRDVTREAVQRVARRVLRPGARVSVYGVPG